MKQDMKSESRYNLSEWALKNKGLILYFMLLLGIVGIVSYSKLAQSEDPPFTFKVMVIQTYWPGATAEEVSLQVTDRIEKELMSTGKYERIMAFSRPGESMVTFVAICASGTEPPFAVGTARLDNASTLIRSA